jgi:hypothetical protein
MVARAGRRHQQIRVSVPVTFPLSVSRNAKHSYIKDLKTRVHRCWDSMYVPAETLEKYASITTGALSVASWIWFATHQEGEVGAAIALLAIMLTGCSCCCLWMYTDEP